MVASTCHPVVSVPSAASLGFSTPDLDLAMDKLPPATQASGDATSPDDSRRSLPSVPVGEIYHHQPLLASSMVIVSL
jgi:hypothetical protein